MSDSNPEGFRNVLIAKWFDRFIAWLIDVIIISSISWIIISSVYGTWDFDWEETAGMPDGVSYIPASILFLFYWIVLEFKTGQSIGKKNISFEGSKYRWKISFLNRCDSKQFWKIISITY